MSLSSLIMHMGARHYNTIVSRWSAIRSPYRDSGAITCGASILSISSKYRGKYPQSLSMPSNLTRSRRRKLGHTFSHHTQERSSQCQNTTLHSDFLNLIHLKLSGVVIHISSHYYFLLKSSSPLVISEVAAGPKSAEYCD